MKFLFLRGCGVVDCDIGKQTAPVIELVAGVHPAAEAVNGAVVFVYVTVKPPFLQNKLFGFLGTKRKDV